jgi:hypothetical protein
MALGSTQPLTEMSTRSISWGKKRTVRKADNLTTILGHCHVIWEPYLPGTLWAPRACNGTALPLHTEGSRLVFQSLNNIHALARKPICKNTQEQKTERDRQKEKQ